MDARQVRTRRKLTEAICELAKELPFSAITVSELTARAQINRSTFYQHANSPAELLVDIMRQKLDEIRAEHISAEIPVSSQIRQVTLAVIAHLDEYDFIYKSGLSAANPIAGLHSMLYEHFEESIRALYDAHQVRPIDLPGVDAGLYADSAAKWLSQGSVGAMHAWLSTKSPRDPEVYFTISKSLTPSWWPNQG